MSLRENIARRLAPRSFRLAEITQQAMAQNTHLNEAVNRLEQEFSSDEEWRRLGMDLQLQFTRAGLDDLMAASRAMYMSHPLIQRAVNVTTYYTWAQGWQYEAEDERIMAEVVEPMLANESNRLELYGHQARVLTDVDQIVDGNIFLPLFTDAVGDVNVRSIPSVQVREIITHPQDAQQVWFYRRVWSQQEFDETTGRFDIKQYECLYPDIRYQPARQPGSIGGVEVRWDAPVIHQRTGGLKHMQFGVPQTYAALDWARAYQGYLEDWHTLMSSLARFAWSVTSSKSKAQKLRERLRGRDSEEELEESELPTRDPRRRVPVPGAIWADKEPLTPINKTGSAPDAEGSKPSRLMVASSMDLPDTILCSDPQQGALATAKTLDRPTELGFINRQTMWNDLDARIFRYVVDAKVRRGRLPGRSVRTPDGTVVEPGIDATVKTAFPPILEHDTKEVVQAIVAAATLEGKTDAGTIPKEEVSRQLMSALSVEDIEAALEDLEQQEQDELKQAMDDMKNQLAAMQGQPSPPPPVPSPNGAGAET
jgi:hypothetical protein